MTRCNKRWLAPALAVAVLLTAGVVWAQPRGGGHFGPPGGGPPGLSLLAGPIADRLELSDEQRDTIRGIVEVQRQTTEPWHEDMKRLGAELEKAIEADPFDEEAVRALARQVADVRVELAVARARTANEVRAVLTPDQRETLGEMREQRRQYRAELGGSGGRGSRGRGPQRRGPGG